jgi:DNA phosphorothioation system restriction enzyme
MGLLTDLDLRITYRSGEADLIGELYVPCLSRSVLYRRAVGYFTSNGLAVAAKGISSLIANEGRVQLVASPCLSTEDITAIQNGYVSRDARIRDVTQAAFEALDNSVFEEGLSALEWLISNKRLDVKLAVPVNRDGTIRPGLYHEKIGIFSDIEGNHVAFRGSANETFGGLVDNFESLEVFWSWDDPHGRAVGRIREFDCLWNDTTPSLVVMDFTEATASILRPYRRDKPPASHSNENERIVVSKPQDSGPTIPSGLKLRDYQEEAVKNWFKNDGEGTLKMATGSGKSITALAAASKLFHFGKTKHLIVVCPFRHLVRQWEKECQRFGLWPILAFESRSQWAEALNTKLYNVKAKTSPFVSVITTNRTFASDYFQAQLQEFPRSTLIIADEVHNLGATNLCEKLPSHLRYRIGLSATPERWFDDEGSKKLFSYFGSQLKPEFTLKDAIAKEALVPYSFHPLFVELTEDEGEKYQELSERIAKLWAIDQDEPAPAMKMLLMQRARLVATATNKLSCLRELMQEQRDCTHMLFYCGDGSLEENGECLRHVEAVCQLLGHDLGIRVSTFTAETPSEEREDLLSRLDEGRLQGLVAIRCLDEGVDVPSIRKAVILASSSNPRQFVQRRGRVLRPCLGKRSAEIYDMIVVPPADKAPSDAERNLMRREISRYIEFADLALNAGEARAKILPIQETYGLLDM